MNTAPATRPATMTATTQGQRLRRRPPVGSGSAGDTLAGAMSMTLWIGLGTVVVGAMVLVPMIFAAEPEPATVEANPEGGDAVIPQRRARLRHEPRPLTIRVPETVSIHPAWWERIRGLVG